MSSTSTSTSLSYHCRTIRCLLKFQGSLDNIVSTSALLSKIKRTTWFPRFLTLKPFFDRHRGVKVAAIALIFKALFVKNLAAMMCSVVASSWWSRNFGPSVCEIESSVHCLVKSSMDKWEKRKNKESVSQTPKERTKNPTSLRVTLSH